MRATIALGPTAMSATALTETAIGTAFVVPKGTKCIEGVKVSYCAASTNDAAKPHVPRLRIYSQDLKIEPCEILCEGVGSSLANSDAAAPPMHYYPLNISTINKDGTAGGQTIYFYGTVFVAVTTAGWMGVTIVLNDIGPVQTHINGEDYQAAQYFYKASAAITATVTTTLTETKETNTYRLAGAGRITGLYGVVYQVTAAAATGINGKFTYYSTDFKIPFSLSMNNEPADSLLLAGAVATHLTLNEHLDILCNDQCTVQGAWYNGATNIVGGFVTGVQFVAA